MIKVTVSFDKFLFFGKILINNFFLHKIKGHNCSLSSYGLPPLLDPEPLRLGSAINLGLAVMLNSPSNASDKMFKKVFSNIPSTVFPNSGILEKKTQILKIISQSTTNV